MADVFLSYKREDKPLVEALAKALEADGLSVWWDTDLPLGKSYAASISGALMEAKVVIPVWTARSVGSEWVQEEATAGKRRGVLIPLRLEAVEPPIGFGMIQTADLSDWKPGDNSHPEWVKLTTSVRAMIAVSGAPSSPMPAPPAPMPRRAQSHGHGMRNAVIAGIVVAISAAGGVSYLLNRPQNPDQAVSSQPLPAASTQPKPAQPKPRPTTNPTVSSAPAARPVTMPKSVAPIITSPAHAPEPAAPTAAATTPESATPAPAGAEPANAAPATAEPAPAATQGRPGGISYATDQGVAVNGFAFSPDGKSALSAGNDGTVKLLDTASGEEIRQFAGFGPRILQALFSKTGEYAVVGASDSSVTFVEIASGDENGRFLIPGTLFQMAPSPDDGSIGALTNDNRMRVYQADGVLLKTFKAKASPNVYGFAWCPDSDCVLLWGKDGMLEVWNPFVPELVDSLRGHAGTIRAAAFSPNGQRFVTAADDKLVIVWDANNGHRLRGLQGLKEKPMAVAWARDNRRVAVETESGKAYVWDIDGSRPLIVGPERGIGKGWIDFTPDGKSVVLGGGAKGPMAVRIPD